MRAALRRYPRARAQLSIAPAGVLIGGTTSLGANSGQPAASGVLVCYISTRAGIPCSVNNRRLTERARAVSGSRETHSPHSILVIVERVVVNPVMLTRAVVPLTLYSVRAHPAVAPRRRCLIDFVHLLHKLRQL